MSKEIGLYWIYRFRVSYRDFDSPSPYYYGWATHGYVCTNEGLQRYCNFLEWDIQKLEQRFPGIVAYHLWEFPWHGGGASSSQKSFYYNNVVPAMVSAARKHTDKLLIVSTCYNKPEEFVNMKKVDDNNVAYSFCYYPPQQHGFDCYEPTWNYDEDYQWNLIKPAVDFMNTYNVPLNVAEFGVRIDRKDQVDKLKLKLQILDHYHVGWCYWWYSWYAAADCHFTLFYGDEGTDPKQGIIDALIEYSEWEAK